MSKILSGSRTAKVVTMNTTETNNQNTDQKFKVWKSIKVGTYSDPYSLVNAIHGFRYLTILKMGPSNEIDAGRIKINEEIETIDLVFIRPVEIGLSGSNTYADICKKAKEFGLEICPQETGFQLALQYDNVNDNVVYKHCPFVASAPMESVWLDSPSVRLFIVFFIKDGKLMMSTKDIVDHYYWNDTWPMIFRIKK